MLSLLSALRPKMGCSVNAWTEFAKKGQNFEWHAILERRSFEICDLKRNEKADKNSSTSGPLPAGLKSRRNDSELRDEIRAVA
ncbi:MAG: hypothetical protein Ct9H300mP8_00880 [Gammaproteobacteria bacterium]|nr:MAG: hypothetical protein Ct9H300mP8_00880 [Gammaproteobacteria bacterium]